MSLRPPSKFSARHGTSTGIDLLGHEIMAEKAASLGRAGERVEETLARLRAHEGDADRHALLLKGAADAVYALLIQREFCGLTRHDSVIRHYSIPKQVLARLGVA